MLAAKASPHRKNLLALAFDAERVTPLVLCVLGFLFMAVTAAIHLDPGRASSPILSPAAARGRTVWLEKNCQVCHQIYGLGGFLGPDLTNAYSRRGDQYIRFVLGFGMGNMRKFPLSASQLDDVVEYLRALDQTGHYPVTRWPASGLPN